MQQASNRSLLLWRRLTSVAAPRLPFSVDSGAGQQPPPLRRTRVLYDGGCPLCSREVALVRKANGLRSGELTFEFCDITKPEQFDPVSAEHGISREQAMSQLHVIGQDGRIYRGVEAFRRMYSDAGWDGLVEMTKIPSVNRLLTSSYAWFAKHRTKLQSLGQD